MTRIYTLGHSTRGAQEFRELVAAFDIQQLVDVRQFAGSRRFPQFSAPALAESLEEIGVQYVHEPELGGRRRTAADSPNTFWHNAAFRGFADYMRTASFEHGLDHLLASAGKLTTAIMCAEAVPWRCHRWLISDTLVSRGVEVVHILGPNQTRAHALNEAARMDSHGRLTYPGLLAE